MDGSDDYFDDDLVLDEQTLASIDKQEQQWQAAQGKPKVQPVHEHLGHRRLYSEAPPPEPKRQKTSHNPSHEVATFAPSGVSGDYEDDLPDISVEGRGYYNVSAAQRASVDALAAQMRSEWPQNNGVSGLVPASVPPRLAINRTRRDSEKPKPKSRLSGATIASGSGQPPAPLRLPNQSNKASRDAKIQAALAEYASQASQSSTPGQIAQRSRASPVPRAPSSIPHQAPRANSVRPSRPAASRAPGRGSASGYPVDRRQSGPARQRTASPAAPCPSQGSSQQLHYAQQLQLQSQHQPTQERQPSSTQRQVPQQQQSPQLQTQRSTSHGSTDRILQIELESLKAQFEQLLKAQEQTAKALEEAQNARYAKEGEVSILRKSIEKAARDHISEVERIKAAKEQAEAAQAEVKKQMDAKLERMKTEYLFKQHELETSKSKTPRAVRFLRESHTPGSAQLREQPQTPTRPERKDLPESPRPRRKKLLRMIESPPKQAATLPGFVNAFEPTTQHAGEVKTSVHFAPSQPSQSAGKGKERAPVYDYNGTLEAERLFFHPLADDTVHQQAPPDNFPMEGIQEEAPAPSIRDSQPLLFDPAASGEPKPSISEDVEMEDSKPDESAASFKEPNWAAELHRVLLTHQYHSAKQLSVQLFLEHVIPSPERAQLYKTCCTKLLQSLGMTLSSTGECIVYIADVLISMGRLLCNVDSILQITVLMDMMKAAALLIPTFVPLLLAPRGVAGAGDTPPAIFAFLCDTVKELLVPQGCGLDQPQASLAAELMDLLEAICWNTPSEFGVHLSLFLRHAGVLVTLVNAAQPTWLLCRTIRVFTFIVSFPSLPKQFLSFPWPEASNEAGGRDYSKIPHVERLASLLIDRKRDETESRMLGEAILQLITTVAVSHADCTNILLRSQTLLHSIIFFLMNITDPLWEEHEGFISSPELVRWTVETMMRIVVLLYHMFTTMDTSTTNLRLKLMASPKRIFNSSWHMFIVTLGRISYAHPPYCILPEDQVRLEQICDLARSVLELVVDDPELEAIWAGFHVDDNVAPPRTQGPETESENQAAIMIPADLN